MVLSGLASLTKDEANTGVYGIEASNNKLGWRRGNEASSPHVVRAWAPCSLNPRPSAPRFYLTAEEGLGSRLDSLPLTLY